MTTVQLCYYLKWSAQSSKGPNFSNTDHFQDTAGGIIPTSGSGWSDSGEHIVHGLMAHMMSKRERPLEREGGGETETEKEKETKRDRDRERQRQTKRGRETKKDSERDKERQ